MTELTRPLTVADMTSADVTAPAVPQPARYQLSAWQRLGRKLVTERLNRIGLPITISDPDGVVVTGIGPSNIAVRVHDPRFWWTIALDGSNGSGDAYGEGWWTTDDLLGVVRQFALHRERIAELDGGLGQALMPFFRVANRLRRNTKAGSRANIHAHYDLGNTFFSRWLDPTMTYSSGVYAPGMNLHQAQIAKIDRLLQRIELKPGDHLCEIGTGWGELAIRAAQRGAHVTTITISTEQHRLAEERVRAAGLQDRVTVRLCDYRDLDGAFDKVVSVEMIEAVGREYYQTFFNTVGKILKPNGLAVLQAITISEQDFMRAAKESDFIKRRIFPGCCIPSVESLLSAMRRASDLSLISLHDFAPHYARTLEDWRTAFNARSAELETLGYDRRFQRLWEFYLAYCAGGFAERALGVAHLVFARPGWRHADAARLMPVCV